MYFAPQSLKLDYGPGFNGWILTFH